MKSAARPDPADGALDELLRSWDDGEFHQALTAALDGEPFSRRTAACCIPRGGRGPQAALVIVLVVLVAAAIVAQVLVMLLVRRAASLPGLPAG